MILITNGLYFSEHSVILDPLGCYLILKPAILDKQYVLANIYAPNKDKDLLAFLRTIQKLICDNNLDDEENMVFLETLLHLNSYTWSQKSLCVFCRLDYWLISNNLHDFVQSTIISPAINIDHSTIDLCIGDIKKGDNGPGFWKFNCSLLEDENYVDEVKINFQMWIAEGEKYRINGRFGTG